MSRLGIGLYSLAGVYGKKDVVEVQRMLCQAVEWGVTFFDVADHYGPAEEVLGLTLHAVRSRIEISTKVGLTEDGGRNCSRRYIQEACQRSLKRLQTDYLDYYQIHFDDPYTPIEETIEAFEELQHQGYIRHYNIGHLPLKRVKEYAVRSHPSAVMMELSPIALGQYRIGHPMCEEHDLFVIAMGTAGRGLLTGQIREDHQFPAGDLRRIDPLFSHSLRQSAFRVLQTLEEIGRKYDRSPIQVALNWVMHLNRVGIVLTGPSTVAHLQENLGAQGWNLSAEDADLLEQCIQREEVWKEHALRSDLQAILTNAPHPQREQVVSDLVYVLSALVELELADEKEIIPIFQEIMAWERGNGDVNTFFSTILRRIRTYV